MKKRLSPFWASYFPLIGAVIVLWLITAALGYLSAAQNQQNVVYALDDAYIHMAIAKNFVVHGIWGVTRDGFTSSSSSLLWTMLLSAVFALFKVTELAPLILNLLFATMLVYVVYMTLRKRSDSNAFNFIVLLSLIFLTPLPCLIFTGMEHVLQALVTIAFAYLAAGILSDENRRGKTALSRDEKLLLLLSPLVISTRYEGMFLVFVVCVFFFIRRRFIFPLFLGALGLLPVALFGLISMSKGWYALPNSILLKGQMPGVLTSGTISLSDYSRNWHVVYDPHILVLLAAVSIIFFFLYRDNGKLWESSKIMVIIFTATTLLHMTFAKTGSLYRYESYLVALGIFVISASLGKYVPAKFRVNFNRSQIPKYAAIVCFILFISPFVIRPFIWRGAVSLKKTLQATTNIFEQQYQMGLFLREHYQGAAVVANDIGAINFLADIKCLDLAGLGSLEVAKTIRGGTFGNRAIYELAKDNADIGIVYTDLYERYGGIPDEWLMVGQWTILDNVVCGDDTISFYAVDAAQKDALAANLRAFSPEVPRRVFQHGAYLRP